MKGLRTISKYFNSISDLYPSNEILTIITGANSPFYLPLLNLLSSIKKHESNVNVFVWDLGLENEQVESLKKTHPECQYRKFDYSTCPDYFDIRINAGEYAWKSVCIYRTLNESDSDLFLWLDSGCIITHRLNAVRNILKMYGFYSPYSSTTVQSLTHYSVLDYFKLSNRSKNQNMLSGGIVGVNKRKYNKVEIIKEWYRFSFEKDILSPIGSNKSNHRQDQSLLSCIYYSRYKTCPILCRKYYNFLVHQNKGK
ncbi:MAG: hypothetical protein BWX65_00535 [Bacteroidetes bacterium ADurb.Bin057]|nr:MAG: hypothetical protein BWX65_00535 [Bacteroidetes bacterium ADurb.Bin057]HPH72413.1 DUF1647 domain-containing protein [Paludibacteraceae bacterium]